MATIIAQDSYTDTNGVNLGSHTMDVGPGWTVVGTWTIQGNEATSAVNAGAPRQAAVSDSGRSDVTVSVSIDVPNATGYALGPTLRYLDLNNHWAVFLERDAGGTPFVSLVERNGGVNTVRGSANLPTITGTTQTVAATLAGTSITVAVGGTQQVSYSSASFQQTATKFGITIFADGNYVNSTFDNFLVTVPDRPGAVVMTSSELILPQFEE